MLAVFGSMPKRQQRQQDEGIDVYVRVSGSYAELLADLQAIPARARAGRLRLLATLALRQAGPAAAAAVPPPPAPAPVPDVASESTSAATSRRKRANVLKGSLFP